MARYHIRSLGACEVSADGGAPMRIWPTPRALLAQLVVADGPLSVRRIMSELWPLGAPESAPADVRSYVHLIRRALGAHVVQTLHSGTYQLCLPDVRADCWIISRPLDRSTARPLEPSESADGQQERMALLKQALDLWAGPALSGIPHGPMLDRWIARMQGHRRQAVLDLARMLIDAGRCGTAQDLLRQHLLAQPDDETAHLLLMQALSLAGDVGAALTAYQQAHGELTELGLQPGPTLRAAQHVLLNNRPLTFTTAPIPAGPGGHRPPPLS